MAVPFVRPQADGYVWGSRYDQNLERHLDQTEVNKLFPDKALARIVERPVADRFGRPVDFDQHFLVNFEPLIARRGLGDFC